jgi:parallel beta-helix repeat protein
MGTVSGFEAGVVIDGGSANTVENITARDNIGRDDFRNADLGDGIIVFDSPSNRILNNTVVHNGIFDGIGVLGEASDNTIIQGNTVEDTVGAGGGGASGQGIIINGADGRTRELITGTKTESNIVRRSASGGISNINNTDATVMGNIVEDNGLTNNAGNGIGIRAGFGFQGTATRILVQDNRVLRNAQNGIVVLRAARENRIINNVTVDNNRVPPHTGRYFDLRDDNVRCDANVWSGNVWSAAGLYSPICVTNGGSGPLIPPEPEGTGPNPHLSPTCRDEFDNDEDGLVDGGVFPGEGDPDCKPPLDDPEGPPGDPTCSDGLDNDGDYSIDGEDFDCGLLAGPGEPGEGDPFGPGGPITDTPQLP